MKQTEEEMKEDRRGMEETEEERTIMYKYNKRKR